MKLQQYQLFADSSLRIDSQIKEFKWDLEAVAFPSEKITAAKEALEQISEEGALRPDLEDVQAQIAQNRRSPAWLYFFILIGIVIALALGLWIFCFVYTHNWMYMRDGLKLLYDFIWPPKDDPRLYSPILPRKSKKSKTNVYSKIPPAPSRRLPPAPAPVQRTNRPSHHQSDSALPSSSNLHTVEADVHYNSDSTPPDSARRSSRRTRREPTVAISNELSDLLTRARQHSRSILAPEELEMVEITSRRSRSQPREIPDVFARHRRRFL